MTIDMKSYTGELDPPAAVEPEQVSIQEESAGKDANFEAIPSMENIESSEQEESRASVETPRENAQEQNFRALSDSVEKLKAERDVEKREYQLQLDMLRANLAKSNQSDIQKSKKMFDGMEDQDIPNVGELRKAWQEKEAAYDEKIEELQVANQYSDYAQVLNKYGKHLAETDPLFLQGIRGAENKALFAYQYAKKEQRIQELEETLKNKPPATQQSTIAQKIVENARKPGNLAQTGGQSVLSKADYYASMSDKEFMEMASKHLQAI